MPVRQMHRLLELARLAQSQDRDEVLRAVARCVSDVLGYGAVVLNLFRPAWDDLEVVHVEADPEAVRALLGTRATWEDWQRYLRPEFERRGAYVLQQGKIDWGTLNGWIPDGDAPEDPEAWHPEDAVFVPLRDEDGELLGILSVDQPATGRRPNDDDLDALTAVASHAAVALSHARAAAKAARVRTAMTDLLRVSHRVHDGRELDESLTELCVTVRRGLGFEKVVVLLAGPDGDRLAPRASTGFSPEYIAAMHKLRLQALRPILAPEHLREGCALLTREDAETLTGATQTVYGSQRNGRGPRAWSGHWLCTPLHDAAGEVTGLLWADDPEDRLVPDDDLLRALRLFADQAAAAVAAAGHVAHLRHLADHDPLTGVLNRRDLTERLGRLIAAGGPLSLLFADLDHFKWVNDELGHDTGDAVLRRFGTLLRQHAVDHGGHAVRLGGEEFCLVLPDHDADRAFVVGDALRRAAASVLGMQVAGLTLSVGVATSSSTLNDAQGLLRAADQALYTAKRLGRNRCVAYDPALPAVDRRASSSKEPSSATLSAVLLLANALDLRDASTAAHARTVAHYAERTARHLGLDRPRVERVRIAGALHDLGKIAVPDAILRKDGGLTDQEWEEIKRHPEVGAQILAHAGLDDVAAWVLRHHERMDGRGYPDGWLGSAIPLEARILSVCDAYEAMTADRPYRTAMPADAAREELRRCAGTQFDPAVVDALLRALEDEGVASPSCAAA